MQITLSSKAVKALHGLEKSTQARIMAGILGLPKGDIKPLQGANGTLRLRVGDYRVLFSYTAETKILIEKVSPRGGAYKGV
ncbi:MAG: type II toxin-antitoxin system RelE/ParE family toxin [Oscillospiraceae bacterium]|nr:type II toxin-antitoxin system RelE/ParE family toxin [Oscillospiraceae bacterium]